MTPTASASPITLLTTVAAPGNAAPAAAGNAPTPAQGGGFQLLIDTAAQQQLGSQLGAALQKSLPATPSASTEPADDSGNVLPLAGLLLPSAAELPVPSKEEVDKAAASTKDDSSDDTQPATGDAAIQLLWVPVNIQAAPSAPSGNVGSNNSNTAAMTALEGAGGGKGQARGLSTGTQSTGTQNTGAQGADAQDINAATNSSLAAAAEQNNAVAKKDDSAMQLAANADAVAQDGNFAAGKQAPSGRNSKPANDPLVAVPGADAKTDLASLNVATNVAAATKSTEGSNFADILKPETAAQAATGVSAAALDTGRAPQATRPYADMNTATATVALPVGSNGWSDAVVDKVMWFSANQLSNAEIKLNPPDLGPLQVRISTQHDQASVVFSSPHAAVRDALDQALPRLRDMLGGQGIQLSDASVGGQGASRQQQQQQGGESRPANSGFFSSEDNGDTPIAVTRVVGPRLSTSAVDAYA